MSIPSSPVTANHPAAAASSLRRAAAAGAALDRTRGYLRTVATNAPFSGASLDGP